MKNLYNIKILLSQGDWNMKAFRLSFIMISLFLVEIIFITGCKYDVAEPSWDQPFQFGPTPTITQVVPNAATPGVNTITIMGTNLDGVLDNGVYFDTYTAEIIQKTATSIVVRRPNYVSEAAVLKLNSDSAKTVVKYSEPYKIDAVFREYGTFIENLQLGAIAVDDQENVYAMDIESLPKRILKTTSDDLTINVGTFARAPYDARFGPDGRLYLVERNSRIEVYDPVTQETTVWVRVPGSGKLMQYGDFDSNGNFYCGGPRTGLDVVFPDSTFMETGFYNDDEIIAMRRNGNFLYVAVSADSTAKIYRHSLDGNGNVGAQEPFLDFTADAGLASTGIVTAISFSSDGKMYVSVNSTNSMLVVDVATKQWDIFYKGILPPYCVQFSWGTMNYLYLINGNTDAGEQWKVYRVDVGATAAP